MRGGAGPKWPGAPSLLTTLCCAAQRLACACGCAGSWVPRCISQYLPALLSALRMGGARTRRMRLLYRLYDTFMTLCLECVSSLA